MATQEQQHENKILCDVLRITLDSARQNASADPPLVFLGNVAEASNLQMHLGLHSVSVDQLQGCKKSKLGAQTTPTEVQIRVSTSATSFLDCICETANIAENCSYLLPGEAKSCCMTKLGLIDGMSGLLCKCIMAIQMT